MTSTLSRTKVDKGIAALAQSVLAGSKHAPLDSLKIGLCVSGGPDSMALACLVASLKERDLGFGIDPIAFIIDHNARPKSGTEASAVIQSLSKLGIPSRIAKIQWDYPDPLQLPNFEGKAREYRYRLLTELALKHGVKHLFLGHHRDDQVETVILRMIRNQSVSFMDLRGMESTAPVPVPYNVFGARHEIPAVPIESLLQSSTSERLQLSRTPKKQTKINDRDGKIMSYSPGGIFVHRPFLDLTKAELVAACQSRKVDFVTDKTNEDSKFTLRNAVRALRTHELPRALQSDAILQLASKSRQRFRLLQAKIRAYMSNVEIISFNFRSGVAYIQLPRAFKQLAKENQPIAAGVLSQLCQFVSPNPTESFQTTLEAERLEEFVRHFHSPFWASPLRSKAPVFVNSRVVFEGFVPHEGEQSPDSYCWKLSRQPLRTAEIEPVSVNVDPSSTNQPGSYSSPQILWDNRFWIRITSSGCRLFDDLKLRPFLAKDWQYLTEQLPRAVLKTLRAEMSEHAPGNSRYTLPALCFRDKVVALPTLLDDMLLPQSPNGWPPQEQSSGSPFKLKWDVEYKVLPTSIMYRA